MSADIFEKETQSILKEIYGSGAKCRVDSEIILPDYKEDVSRIIRVDVKPRVTGKNTYAQGQFIFCEVEGTLSFNLIYISERRGEKGSVTSFTAHEDFSHVFKTQKDATADFDYENMLAFIELFCENTAFKLLGPRKLSMRSDVNIALCIKCNQKADFYSGALPSDMERKTRAGNLVSLCAHAELDFGFQETITLPPEYLAIGEISDIDVSIFAESVKPMNGKLAFSGLCCITCSYVSADEESFISFYQPIGFSESMEIDECEEDTVCEVNLAPNLLKATPDVNEVGENKIIRLEVGYTAEACVYKNESVNVCEDVYSTASELKTKHAEVGLEYLSCMLDATGEARADFAIRQEGIERAENIKAYVDFRNSYMENGSIIVEGKLYLHFIGIREDNGLSGVDDSVDFKLTLAAEKTPDLGYPDKLIRVEISGGVKSCDIDLNGTEATVRCEIFTHVKIFCREDFEMISEIAKGDPLRREKEGMIFYYPDERESVWDISKKYRVPVARVLEDNQIEGEEVPRVIRIIR